MYGDIHQVYSENPCLHCFLFFVFELFFYLLQGDRPSMAAAFGKCLASLGDLPESRNSFEFHFFLALMSLLS